MKATQRLHAAGTAALLLATSVQGIDFVENFDGAALDPEVWELTTGKTVTVTGGRLTWEDDGDDWASGDIATHQRFFLPPPGETTTILWTLGPGAVTAVNPDNDGQSIRWQVGIMSANETAARKEHWHNSTGGLWIDVDNVRPSDTGQALGGAYSANDTKQPSSQGDFVAGVSALWAWQTDAHVFRLELTDTDFAWYSGDDLIGGGSLESAGIDTEFSNGYRVLALGMNFAAGRGSTSIERVEVQNGGESSSLIASYSADRLTPFSGQAVTLRWSIDPDASATIDNGVGSLDGLTTDGVGAVVLTAPQVNASTAIGYTLTVVKGGESAARVLTLNVSPSAELSFDDLADEFDGDDIDFNQWEYRGERTYSVSDGFLRFDANAGNWGHGEVTSVKAFPLPAPGKSTRVVWAFGPADATVEAEDGLSLRPMVGIFSAFERHTWSRQHWQNTTGGIWLDVTSMGNARPDGVSGDLIYADDAKIEATNGTAWSAFDAPDWSWKTEGHEFSLVITTEGYAWFSGETELGSSTWDEAGIDTEFSAGFKIHAMAGNWNQGRGPMSLDGIFLENGGESGAFDIVSAERGDAGFRLSWNAAPGKTYQVFRSESVDESAALLAELTADSDLASYTDATPPDRAAFYQVANVPAQPLFQDDFESGAPGWTSGVFSPSPATEWELGAPAADQVPSGAVSGSNVFGTDLDADYEFNTDIYLRSPVIDLTDVSTATLVYEGYQDLEPLFDGEFVDFVEIWVLDENDNRLQATPLRKRAGATAGWQRERVFLPAEVLNQRVKLEFLFISDGFDAIDPSTGLEFKQAGWFIDDVAVIPE